MRIPFDESNEPKVEMSPLIDCVFLLLIFFLVTNMMKKAEMQIPLSLPPITSSLSTTQSGQGAVVISVDEENNIYEIINQDAYSGHQDFVPITDLTKFLEDLQGLRGNDVAIDIAAYRDVHVKTVIDVFDKCQQQGFMKTRVRLGSKLNNNIEDETTIK